MASVVVTMDAREAKLFHAMDKLIKKQQQVNEKMKDGGRASETAARKSKDGWDRSAMSLSKMQMATMQYVTGLATIGTAVEAIRLSWEQVRKEQQAGLEALQKTQGTDRRLLQISGSAEEFSRLRGQADALSAQFGVDRNVVRDVIFSAVSENFRDAVPAIIAANQVVDPTAAAGVAGQVPALFKGAIGALESVNLTLKAAEASRLDFSQIAKSLPQAAEGGGIAKATAEETLAVLSVLASEFKSGETAADRMKIFATRAGLSDQFKGQGIVGPLEQLMGMGEEDRRKFLGDSQELNAAYVKMSENIALIKQRIEEMTEERKEFASGGGLLADKVGIAGGDARFAALRQLAREEQALERSQAGINGVEGAMGSAAAVRTERRMMSDATFITRFIESWIGAGQFGARAAAATGFSTEVSSEVGLRTGQITSAAATLGVDAFLTLIQEGAKSLVQSSVNLNQAADKINRSNVGAARAQAAGAGN